MVSVTSEVLANASFQGAQARSARPDSDQSAGNDSFAALVDSNAAASNNDNRPLRTQRPPRAARTIRKPHPTTASRDNAAASDKAASDKAARNDSNDRDAAAKARDDAKADAKVDAEPTRPARLKSTRVAKSKSDAPKSEQSPMKPSRHLRRRRCGQGSDRGSAGWNGRGDGRRRCRRQSHCCRAGSDGGFRRTPAADKATAPLAIAAAAIAASASLASETAPAAPRLKRRHRCKRWLQPPPRSRQGRRRPRSMPQGAVGQAVSARPLLPTPPSRPVLRRPLQRSRRRLRASKAAPFSSRTPVVAKEGAATARRAGQRGRHGRRRRHRNTRCRHRRSSPSRRRRKPRASRRPRTASSDAVKADIARQSVTPPAANANAHSATADAGQTPVNSSGNGLQAAGAIQTQQPICCRRAARRPSSTSPQPQPQAPRCP